MMMSTQGTRDLARPLLELPVAVESRRRHTDHPPKPKAISQSEMIGQKIDAVSY